MDPPRKRPRLSTAAGNEPDIEAMRQEHDRRFLGRLDGILQKYNRDFEGISDEIDMNTGQIVVNNGHVQRARNAYDVGPPVHRGSPYSPPAPETRSQLSRRRASSSALAREIHNVVHHHYAPELHQNLASSQRQPDLASSMIQILNYIERMEDRNERLHLILMDRLGPVVESPRHQRHITQPSQPDQSSPSWQRRRSVPRDRLDQPRPASPRRLARHEPEPSTLTSADDTIDIRNAWTPTEERKVKHMLLAGCSFGQIVKEMPSCSTSSIKLRWDRFKMLENTETDVDTYGGASLTPRRGDIWAPTRMSSPEISSGSASSDDGGEADDLARRRSYLPISRLRFSKEPDAIRSKDLRPIEPVPSARWRQEEDDFLKQLVKKEMQSKSGNGKWKRIIADFIQRYPNRPKASIKPRFTRLAPGGIGTANVLLQQKTTDSTVTPPRPASSRALVPIDGSGQMGDDDAPARSNESDCTGSPDGHDARSHDGDRTDLRRSRKKSHRIRLSPEAEVSPVGLTDEDSDGSPEELEDGKNDELEATDVNAPEKFSTALVLARQLPHANPYSVDGSEDSGTDIDRQEMYGTEWWHQLKRQKRLYNLCLDHEQKWTKEEIQRLETLCSGIPRGQRIRGLVEHHFPERSFRSIQTKLHKLRKVGRIAVPSDPADQPESSKSDTEPQVTSITAAVTTPSRDEDGGDQTNPPTTAQPDSAKRLSSPPVVEQQNTPASSPGPPAMSPQLQRVSLRPMEVIVDSDESEPPSTLGSTPKDIEQEPKSSEPTPSVVLPPRKRGRPSRADKPAREISDETGEPAVPPAKPEEPIAVSVAVDLVAATPKTEVKAAAEPRRQQLPVKRAKRKSDPLPKSVAAGKSSDKIEPPSSQSKGRLPPRKSAAPAFATPQMPPKSKSTPVAYSAPPLRRAAIVPFIDDLSEDELA